MALGPSGIVFVGSRAEGKVYAVVDRDGDHRAEAVHVLASGLNNPSGVAFRDGSLYVAAVNRILRFRDVARDLTRPPGPEVASDAFPNDAHHGWKFIAFGPDGRLYVPVGAPCNICALPGPAPRHDHAPGPRGRRQAGDRRPRRAQHRRLRLPAGHGRAVVHRQRPRLARRRPAARRAQPPEPRPASSTSASPTATATACATPSTTPAAPATSSPRPRACSAPTSPRSACASTPARCSPRSTAAASSSPSTAPGTAARPSATA